MSSIFLNFFSLLISNDYYFPQEIFLQERRFFRYLRNIFIYFFKFLPLEIILFKFPQDKNALRAILSNERTHLHRRDRTVEWFFTLEWGRSGFYNIWIYSEGFFNVEILNDFYYIRIGNQKKLIRPEKSLVFSFPPSGIADSLGFFRTFFISISCRKKSVLRFQQRFRLRPPL